MLGVQLPLQRTHIDIAHMIIVQQLSSLSRIAGRIDQADIGETVEQLIVVTLLTDMIGPAKHIGQTCENRDAAKPLIRDGGSSFQQYRRTRDVSIEPLNSLRVARIPGTHKRKTIHSRRIVRTQHWSLYLRPPLMIVNTRYRPLSQKHRATQNQHNKHHRPRTPHKAPKQTPQTLNSQCTPDSKEQPRLDRKLEYRIHAFIVSTI